MTKDEIIKEQEQTNAQLSLNFQHVLGRFDSLHKIICKDQIGTWKQRVEQVVKAALELHRNNKKKE